MIAKPIYLCFGAIALFFFFLCGFVVFGFWVSFFFFGVFVLGVSLFLNIVHGDAFLLGVHRF